MANGIKKFPHDKIKALPSYPFEISPEDTSRVSKFEDGTTQGLKIKTRSREVYSVNYNDITYEDFKIIYSFLKDEVNFGASSFLWINPITNETQEVRLLKIKKAINTSINYWSINFEVGEI
ncbi:MAG: hypothetical protein QP733_01985 [Dialister micraerophilus]|uniref:hypothetical protein n=1 Tax=Dialister micraerophilus TaxID=309120 RepID=UPI002551AA6D|nr:hypothetical protein [Dialister micraerophilus]MDK8253210.1 hypothetical protein [Dialister micraerophilus]